MTQDVYVWATESSPLSTAVTDTALSRTGEDSGLLRHYREKPVMGMGGPSRSTVLRDN